MFREYIGTPIDPIPQQYINTLTRLKDEPDYSLTCLGIALLKQRIKDYKGIGGAYKSLSVKSGCMKDFLKEFNCYDTKEVPQLYFYKYTSDDDSTADFKELLNKGFVVKENIGTFLKAKAGANGLAVYHKEKNIAAFFVSTLDIRIYHILISFISLLLPKLFEEMPLRKPEDYDIIMSLCKPSKDMFVEKVQTAVRPYLAEFRKIMLADALKIIHDRKIRDAYSQVETQRNYIDEIEKNYIKEIKNLRNLIVVYEGMKAVEVYDDAENELVDYLSGNRSVKNLNVSQDGSISFSVATVLNNWNEEVWDTFDKRGFIYDGMYGRARVLDAFTNKSNVRILLNAIFSESAEFKVKMAGNYTLDMNNCYISSNRAYDYENADPAYKSYIPNPHLKLFACLGGYRERVIKALRNRNYISAIEMCCASAGSVNLEETEQTFRPFVGWILSSREKVLRRNDGVEMTPEEALIYLIDKEK